MGKLTVICGLLILGVAFASYPGFELYTAAKNGDIAFVTHAIATGTDVNSKNPRSGSTALMVASHRNQAEVVKLLLDAGATVDETDIAGHTALYFAVSTGSIDVVPILIARGANPNAQIRSGTTVTIAAARGNNLSILKMLIDAGADVNLAQDNGWAPLHFAAQDNKMDIAKKLLQAGANKNALVTIEDYDTYSDDHVGPNESTPITIALENDHIELANFIENFPPDSYFDLLVKGATKAYAVVKFFTCILTT